MSRGGSLLLSGIVSAEAARDVRVDEPAAARGEIDGRWQAVLEPTYARLAVKATSVKQGALPHLGAGDHGTEWGTVIHLLLETAMKAPSADLSALAASALAEAGLDTSRCDEAVDTVNSVMASELWKRASQSPRRLVELPIQALLPADPTDGRVVPTILRGVIDLAFAEGDGWVIVDYKTDEATGKRLADLVELYRPQVRLYADAFQTATSATVRETGLYFTSDRRYVKT